MQKAANAELRTTLPAKDPSGIATALVSVKPGNGQILAMAQNRKFVANGDKAKAGQTTINFSTDQAHGGSQGFSSGSTYKAFVLAEWLRSGRALTTKVDATGQERTGDDFTSRCTGKFVGVYNPGNSDGPRGHGKLDQHRVRIDAQSARPLRRSRHRRGNRIQAVELRRRWRALHWPVDGPRSAEHLAPRDGIGLCHVRKRRNLLRPRRNHEDHRPRWRGTRHPPGELPRRARRSDRQRRDICLGQGPDRRWG